ncbi:tetratricopeptide repeat protein [Poseidonocella sp. HB161398]|uniref:tetratricopeptide repeat protein n=1 Tax=Poseidonocella sp. HB161398 TaxID=2320855 RepID=UPI00110A0371|nr:tetratricopeptide repeat protein [Poseidonocella sp. HB161398]
MPDLPERLLNAADLLVRVLSVAVDPTGLSAAGHVVGGMMNLRTVFSRKDAAAPLAAQIAQGLQARFATGDWPDEAEVLFPQMLESAMPAPSDLAAGDLNAGRVLDRMAARLADMDPEFRRAGMIEGFRRWLEPVLAGLLADATFSSALAPVIATEALNRLTRIETALAQLAAQYGSVGEALDSVGALARASADQLEALATRFGIADAFERSSGELRELLEQKAKDYRALLRQVEGLDDRVAAIATLKGAAQDAIRRGDLEEVETLLCRVDEVETEIAAETKLARADNALLRGRVGEAYRILSAAADSFGSIDPAEPARRRINYGSQLRAHGLRYGGMGLAHAIDMYRADLWRISQKAQPQLRAELQNNLGLALQDLGGRTAGEPGTDMLAESVSAFRDALAVFTADTQPLNWAMAQNNLGIALAQQGRRTAGDPGTILFSDSANACREALTVYTRDAHPQDWAMTLNTLGLALQELGRRTAGGAGIDFLAESVAAFQEALAIYTEDALPLEWAMTQNNLGVTLAQQGRRTAGMRGVGLLAESTDAYQKALAIHTPDAHPFDWAMTRMNLGAALLQQGIRTAGEAGTSLLDRSVEAFRSALAIYTREAEPLQWATTQENIAIAEEALARHDACTDRAAALARALSAVERALAVYDPVHLGFYNEKASRLRQQILDVPGRETPG